MINGNYELGLSLALQKTLIDNLFNLGPFSTLKTLTKQYDAYLAAYKKHIPTLAFSSDRDYKLKLAPLNTFAEAVTELTTQVKVALFEKRDSNQKNVLIALTLMQKYLTELSRLIEELKKEAK